jgi:CRISPR-associated protein Cas1
MQDLHDLPKLRDSLSYLYVEHAILDRKDSAIEAVQKEGRTMIPIAALWVLMLGPGTSITHAAVKVLAENGCLVLWTGEEATHFYAQGLGETRKSYHLLRQAELACDHEKRAEVVLRMYRKRFQEPIDPSLDLVQLRGMEGVRVREAYAHASREWGVPWSGRRWDIGNWNKGDVINRALSAANALLNSVCHSAIVSGGYSPALGFIHTGRMLSFVYDIADLYKTEMTIPAAFQATAEAPHQAERQARTLCREKFRETRLLERILPDIDDLLGIEEDADTREGDLGLSPAEALWEGLYENQEEEEGR